MNKIRFAIIISSLLFSLSLSAGRYAPEQVTVSEWYPGLNQAKGSMGGARYSSSDIEEIGCRLAGISDGTTQVQCQAVDASGARIDCISTEPAIVAAAQSMTTYAWIWFTTDSDIYSIDDLNPPGPGTCERLYVSGKSLHIPDTRDQNPGGNN